MPVPRAWRDLWRTASKRPRLGEAPRRVVRLNSRNPQGDRIHTRDPRRYAADSDRQPLQSSLGSPTIESRWSTAAHVLHQPAQGTARRLIVPLPRKRRQRRGRQAFSRTTGVSQVIASLVNASSISHKMICFCSLRPHANASALCSPCSYACVDCHHQIFLSIWIPLAGCNARYRPLYFPESS
jgi:hypothetical protein